jgi:uncharacterized YccA/Bax inhibitor family protein
MALTAQEVKRLMIAATSADIGNQLADSINAGEDLALQTSHTVAALIIATAVSTTTDFASLKVGDRVLVLAVAGGAALVTVATVGTLPQAAVVGSIYVVMRPRVVPTVPTEKF